MYCDPAYRMLWLNRYFLLRQELAKGFVRIYGIFWNMNIYETQIQGKPSLKLKGLMQPLLISDNENLPVRRISARFQQISWLWGDRHTSLTRKENAYWKFISISWQPRWRMNALTAPSFNPCKNKTLIILTRSVHISM